MKRLTSVFVAILLALTMSTYVHAATSVYEIDELGVSLSIPDNYSVITRETPASDPIFDTIGVSKSELISQFESTNIYLNAIPSYFGEEIVVTMTPNSISDFNNLSDTLLSSMASGIEDEYKSYNISVLDHETYNHRQAKFIKVHYKDTSQSAYGMQYYTVLDYKAMNFTLRSYDGDITSSQEKVIQSIVDSIAFDNAPIITRDSPEKDNANSGSTSTVYEDNEAGIEFTVPADWEEKSFSKPREYFDTKFASKKEAGLIILFGATDLWNKMPNNQKGGLTRDEIDDSMLSKSDIADILSLDSNSISDKTYNGIHYYESVTKQSSEDFEGIKVTITHLIHIQNGWVYWFQFSGDQNNPYYSDFEGVLNSVIINNGSSNQASYQGTTSAGKPTSTNGNLFWLIAIIVAGTITAIIIIVIRSKKKKISVQNSSIIDTNAAQQQPANEHAQKMFCHKCGAELPLDSLFCKKCGAKQHIDEE